ncbi:hypothetical protein MHC_03735 [Mycoplasma haemocanis str. Illinois]|uniref:Uncharacterized protein n=1 Tax=Mycoplasma haemocanis (strain Illinois) TaxID=1111676 RepID=H6N7I5_MYCHN|nr:hypothetical protein [Mycoplasma haemocanis]AEW45607.2 hypothetical protein MHC_03735 [Mycoplasma haemocanis str. Illinois]
MTAFWLSKAVLGGSIFMGTSVGAGVALLTPSGSTSAKSIYKKGCRIHKLISSANGTFEKIDHEELEQEILSLRQGNFFQKIKEVCERDKDVLIHNPDSKGWQPYDKNDGDSSQVKNKFKDYLKK